MKSLLQKNFEKFCVQGQKYIAFVYSDLCYTGELG